MTNKTTTTINFFRKADGTICTKSEWYKEKAGSYYFFDICADYQDCFRRLKTMEDFFAFELPVLEIAVKTARKIESTEKYLCVVISPSGLVSISGGNFEGFLKIIKERLENQKKAVVEALETSY